jgi:hypothetical protein
MNAQQTAELIDDLKQFIVTTVSQAVISSELRIKARFDSTDSKFDGLQREVREGFANIAEIVSLHNDAIDDHDERIKKLEPIVA